MPVVVEFRERAASATAASRSVPAWRWLSAGASLLVLASLPSASAAEARAGTDALRTAQADGVEQRSFDIPGGDLQSALMAFSDAVGLQLLYPAELTAGLTTPGVRGTHTPDAALRRLLAGTGLQHRFTDADTVTLAQAGAQASGGPLQLGPITVEGWRSTETRGYRSEVISSATKTDTPIVDVPASVSVVTEDVIEDQNATSLTEALRNVPGVGSGPNPANVSVQEEFTIRGFENSLINVNGVERRSTGPLSTANIESVEVLKGPFSVLYGTLSPGGLINVQTKRPEREAAYELQLGGSQATTGRGTQGRGVVDLTGPVTSDGSVLYRFIASADGGTSFIDEVEEQQYLINPSVSFLGLDDDLRVDLDFSYLRNDDTFRFGIPARGGDPDTRIDRTAFLGAADNEKLTEDFNAEIRAEYAATDATKIDAAFTYHLNEHFSRALRPFGTPGQEVQPDDTIRRSFSLRSFDTTDIEFEANAVHDLAVGPTDWRFLVGGDVRRTRLEDTGPGAGNIVDFDRVNVLAPNSDVDLPDSDDPRIAFFPDDEQTIDSYGFYGQVETWLYDRVKLLAGVRYDNIRFDFEDESGFTFSQRDEDLSPRAAGLVKVTPSTSLYASYTSSFQQELSFDPDAEPFDPTEAQQWEVGVKQEFFDRGLIATLSAFHLEQENLVQPDPVGLGSVQIGEARSQGVEAEIQGQIGDDVRLIAGYTFLDNEISEATDGTEGNRLGNVPKHAANVFATYDVYETEQERLTVGGGVFYVGRRFASQTNAVELPDYVTVDAKVEYAFTTGGLDLKADAGVKNLFDEEFFFGGFPAGASFRGEPRTVFARLTARF